MSDLTSPTAIWAKGVLFLCLGLLSTTLLMLMAPSFSIAVAHAVAVWAFCRFYYFAFYVIERYVDPTYRFAGLIDFARYALRRRAGRPLDRWRRPDRDA